jgi:hypothetical protein
MEKNAHGACISFLLVCRLVAYFSLTFLAFSTFIIPTAIPIYYIKENQADR